MVRHSWVCDNRTTAAKLETVAAPFRFEPAKPAEACCAEEKTATPLTGRSLYQLDATWTNDIGRSVQLTSLYGRPVVLIIALVVLGDFRRQPRMLARRLLGGQQFDRSFIGFDFGHII